MSRGITPVIAIILLLLMSVAAAGAVYFFYQNISETSEGTSSSQIEQVSEKTMAQLSIESVAGGRVYARNRGAGSIDASKLAVYVEDKPYSFNSSLETISGGDMAVLKFTEVPSCDDSKCTVKIRGAASTSKIVEDETLSCSSDSDCLSGETCEGGICLFGEGEETTCGDGTCDASEHGYDCFEDCNPESILYAFGVVGADGGWLAQYDWNGTTYDFVDNLTEMGEIGTSGFFSAVLLANGNHIISGHASEDEMGTYWLSQYDGSSWSYPYNLSNEHVVAGTPICMGSSDADSDGDVMFVYSRNMGGGGIEELQWAAIEGGSLSSPSAVSGVASYASPAFSFSPDGNGALVYTNRTNLGIGNNQYKVVYRAWDGSSFGSPDVFFNQQNSADLDMILAPLVAFAENGDGMAVWMVENETNHVFHKYATHDGLSWTYQGNFENFESFNESDTALITGLEFDHLGNAVATSGRAGPGGASDHYAVYDNGAWGQTQGMPESTGKIWPHLMKMPDSTLVATDMDYDVLMAGGREMWRWTVWNGNSWSDPVHIGPWEIA